ncbi:TIGR04255 family protein [Nocardioides okcheonensis]|uniref:TIGR04255 family protein n=1 Tax=Nocardioides okcheonensis TaxID=2894081 RepID=UPI001E53D84A|nr:TIGR04255 family protein [Nocardioides okcheonensis]UFN46074.1 TIGR04255 family protein [Nocardioides okcheonensis]
MGTDVKFSNPPVAAVMLTVYFEAIETLQPIHLSRLREMWRDRYPTTGNLPPLRPHPLAGVSDDDDDELTWQFPYMIFGTDDESDAVAIQNDRFVRSWHFTEGASSYPGFDELRADMAQRFQEFKTVVQAEVGRDVVLTASECRYTNPLPKMPMADLLVGVASGWKGNPGGADLSMAHYGSVFFHLDDPELPASHVSVDLDVDEADGATMTIRSRYAANKLPSEADDQGEVLELAGVDLAHAALIRTFLTFTSSEMQTVWGIQK